MLDLPHNIQIEEADELKIKIHVDLNVNNNILRKQGCSIIFVATGAPENRVF